MTRAQELAARLGVVEDRIRAACAAVGRTREQITLIGVTKTYPVSDAELLVSLGVHDLGESREPEASRKAAAFSGTPAPRWHFVGQIQSRKAKIIAGYAHAVHSLDRVAVAERLDAARPAESRALDVFVQVSLDGDPSRGGVVAADVPALAEHVASLDRLRLVGVMAVAPRDADPDAAFALLREVSESLTADHPQAAAISAGMTHDLEQAIQNAATHVRVGSALLGDRQT